MNGVLCVKCSDVFAGKDWEEEEEEQSFSVWAAPSMVCCKVLPGYGLHEILPMHLRGFYKNYPQIYYIFSAKKDYL